MKCQACGIDPVLLTEKVSELEAGILAVEYALRERDDLRSRVAELERERDDARARETELEAMLGRWQDESGLEGAPAGDPGDVTPEAAGRYWMGIEKERDDLRARVAELEGELHRLEAEWLDGGAIPDSIDAGTRVWYYPVLCGSEYRTGTARSRPARNINDIWVVHVDLDDGETIFSASLRHLRHEPAEPKLRARVSELEAERSQALAALGCDAGHGLIEAVNENVQAYGEAVRRAQALEAELSNMIERYSGPRVRAGGRESAREMEFQAWDELNSEESEAKIVWAHDAKSAAERYAANDIDGQIDDLYYGGHPIAVRDLDKRLWRFNVLGYSEVRYSATDLESEASNQKGGE